MVYSNKVYMLPGAFYNMRNLTYSKFQTSSTLFHVILGLSRENAENAFSDVSARFELLALPEPVS